MTTMKIIKKTARRNARANGTTHQFELNRIAQAAGYANWGGYAQTLLPEAAEQEYSSQNTIPALPSAKEFRSAWNLPLEDRSGIFLAYGFMPRWNVLAKDKLPQVSQWEAYAEIVAEALIPIMDRADYFRNKARLLLQGFITLELLNADSRGRTASIPHILDDINAGLKSSSEKPRVHGTSRDHLSKWFEDKAASARHAPDGGAASNIFSDVSRMAPNERAGVLGTMDQALLPFKNPVIREMTA